jgi:ABC-type multidrug transport system permease subunit
MIVPEFISACAMMFVDNRNVWLGREYPSRVYGWVAFSSSQVIAEMPWAFTGGVIFYVIFYFLIGLPLGMPAGYTFIMMILFHQFSTSWGQWIAALRYVYTSLCLSFS